MRNPVPQQNFGQQAQERFPDFPFYRRAHGHASFYRSIKWPKSRSAKGMALAYQVASDFGQQLAEYLDKSFPGTTWMIKGQDLQALLMNDTLNLWEEGKTVETQNRIQNPVTGNYFHRIGLNDGMAFGVRVWREQYIGPILAFRVRVEPQDESELTSRMKLQQPVADAINRYGEIVNELGTELIAGLAEQARKYVATSLEGQQDMTGVYPAGTQDPDDGPDDLGVDFPDDEPY